MVAGVLTNVSLCHVTSFQTLQECTFRSCIKLKIGPESPQGTLIILSCLSEYNYFNLCTSQGSLAM